jgi:hypothetical protein
MHDRFNGVCILSYVRDPDLPSLMDKLSMFSHGMRGLYEFFTVPHVFLPESGRFRRIPGIPGEWTVSSGAC